MIPHFTRLGDTIMVMLQKMLLAAMLASLVACGDRVVPPAGPVSTQPPSVNQSPQIVTAEVTPTLGVTEVTTFGAHAEVRDPDGDPVTLRLTGCRLDIPVNMEGTRANVSFRTSQDCLGLTLTATDSKGAEVKTSLPFTSAALNGPFRLAIGSPPRPGITDEYGTFFVRLTQVGAVLTGTIADGVRTGVTDPAEPGEIDGEARFRVRFKLEPAGDFTLIGTMVAAPGDMFTSRMVGRGFVSGARYAGKPFELWWDSTFLR